MVADQPPQTSLIDQTYQLADYIADLFLVSDITIDVPKKEHVRFRGTLLCDLTTQFDTLRQRFERYGYTPMIREEDGQTVLIGMPHIFRPKPTRPLINLLLFIATIFTTLLVGSLLFSAETLPASLFTTSGFTRFLQILWRGWPFSLSILTILGAHELGHYFAARYHKVNVSLPYFIPVPTIIGTMGAFIAIREPIKNRRALFDIGASGPLAGLVFAIPILAIGLATSDFTVYNPQFAEGNSILYALMKVIVLGQYYPSNGVDVQLNQMAYAGWCGLLVTGINLMPVGQLDGGHSAFVLFGKKAKWLYWPVILSLIVISLIFQTTIWIVWTILLFFVGRVRAEPLDDVSGAGPARRVLAVVMLVLFFMTFVPVPFP
jgi:membrane-associated protease RseP (regulator of RpoE activity)